LTKAQVLAKAGPLITAPGMTGAAGDPPAARQRSNSQPSPAGRGQPILKGRLIMGLDNPIHIAFLLILLLLVFGAKRLPEMGRSLGSGMRGFRDSLSGDHDKPALAVAQGPDVAAVADVHAAPQSVHAAPQALHVAPQPVHAAPQPTRERPLSA
jgi:sec-independent protein translocase protein TatA